MKVKRNIPRTTRLVKKRGGVIRYRTIVPRPGRYIHVAITRKHGPQGGRTIAGPVRYKKNPYQPTKSDLQWVQNLITKMDEGETWKTPFATFRLLHSKKILKIMGMKSVDKNDQVLVEQCAAVFGHLGWTTEVDEALWKKWFPGPEGRA